MNEYNQATLPKVGQREKLSLLDSIVMDDQITDDFDNGVEEFPQFEMPIKTTKPLHKQLIKPAHQPTLSEYMNNKSP